MLANWVSKGVLSPKGSVDGRDCHVVRYPLPYGYHVLYFDQETFFLRRWDTFDTDKGPEAVLSRTRRYKNISTEPIPANTWKWDVSPEETRRRLTTTQPAEEEKKDGG